MFAHDTSAALLGCAALVNTAVDGEALATTADLAAYLDAQEWTGSRSGDEEELAAVRALRPVLRALWTAGVDELVLGVNALLADGRALPQLVRHGDWGYHVHASGPEAPLPTRMAVEAAMSLADVVREGEVERLRVCAAQDCGRVLLDLSKNRSRRYCEAGCGDRANAAAYRDRVRSKSHLTPDVGGP